MKRVIHTFLFIFAGLSLLSQSQIDALEYFVDSDPGVGNGTLVQIPAPGDTVGQSFSVPVSGLSPGIHVLTMRAKNQSGVWSLGESHPFLVANDIGLPIVKAEYFWDQDPGVGNGLSLLIQDMGNSALIDEQIGVPAGLSLGLHRLFIRVQTSDLVWSLYEGRQVNICTDYGPIASFDADQYGNFISFTNASSDADSVFWDFDDGTTDTARHPNHFFPGIGAYEVNLFAFNECGVDTVQQVFTVGGLEGAVPSTAGKNGFITGRIIGYGFPEDSTHVQFSLADTSGVVLVPDTVIWLNEQNLWFTMSLEGATLGEYDVQYLLNDTVAYSAVKGFEVEPLVFPSLSINMTGNSFSRVGNFNTYTIILENAGNADALMVPIVVEGIPTGEGTIFPEFNVIDSRTFGPYQASRQEFISNGGDSTVLDDPRISIPIDSAGNGGYEAMAFFLTRVPPGTHTIEFSANVTVGNKRIPITAHVLSPFLEYTNVRSDSAAKIADCLRAFADVVLDFASFIGGDITGCLISLTNVVDAGASLGNAVFGGSGELTGIKDRITSFLGGNAHKESPTFTDATLGVVSPTMALMDLIVNCGPLALKLANPGAALTAKLVEMAADGSQAIKIVGNGVGGISLVNNAVKAQEQCFGENGAITKMLFGFFSLDPNSKTGPGVPGDNWINDDRALTYTINFENIDTATAAAQTVTVIDTLDTSVFDLGTFQFLGYGFDSVRIPVVNRSRSFVDVYDLRPGQPNYLQVEGVLDTTSGRITWSFTTLDTTTLQLTEAVFEGFLPPNVQPPEGEGYVTYSIELLPGLSGGTQIDNAADIIFDNNDPIVTNTWKNVLDIVPPQSEVIQPATMPTDSMFVMSWTGRDDISGVRGFTIYVSADGEAYLPYLKNEADTSYLFIGEPGTTYRFYSVATDKAGNVEAPPQAPDTNPDATVTISTSLDPGRNQGPALGKIYPHPAEDLCYLPVTLERPEYISISIYDVTGKLIASPVDDVLLQAGDHQIELDVRNLEPGSYVYRFSSGAGVQADVLMVYR